VHVILFDIDGTLVLKNSTDADELERFKRAIVDEVGKAPPTRPWRYDGMVDPQICRLLLIDVGLSESVAHKHLQRVIERVGEIYVEMQKHPILNDGVGELLKILIASSNHKLGVVTGNLSVVAEEKLALTGIRSYFDETFYSNGYSERRDLVKGAVDACVTKYQLSSRNSVVVVGDTPRDVEAAKGSGAKAIAVATGHFSRDQLTSAGADAVFPDLYPRLDLLKALAYEAT
jgi:phosphoglycolate phosphatase